MRPLTRTTRSVAATEAGNVCSARSARRSRYRGRARGLERVPRQAGGKLPDHRGPARDRHVLWPVLSKLLKDYPDIKVELNAEFALTDIVAERFDAGVRLGEQVEKDMIAVRIAPDARMIVVAAPSCFETRAAWDAAGSDPLPLHQSPVADLWRLLRLGVRQRRRGVRVESTDNLPSTRPPDPGGGAGRLSAWPICRRTSARSPSPRGGCPSARRLVSPVPRLSPLLSEPSSAQPRLHADTGRASLPVVERRRPMG